MSITRKRAGRKSWETRVRFNSDVSNFFTALGSASRKFDTETTKAMIIERYAKEAGKTEIITFRQAYVELSGWVDRAFFNTSESGLSDMLAETFFQGAQVHTPKAVYRLWVKPETKRVAAVQPLMICINDRQTEFKESLSRSEKSDLEVFPDFDRDTFVVVNHDSGKEYQVVLKAAGGKMLASCTCGDFINRSRICKHIGKALRDALCGILAKFSRCAHAEVTA
jgi:hypothetical protein